MPTSSTYKSGFAYYSLLDEMSVPFVQPALAYASSPIPCTKNRFHFLNGTQKKEKDLWEDVEAGLE